MIISRRTLIKCSVLTSAAALLPGLGVSKPDLADLSIERFIFDSRFNAAIDAARRAQSHGIELSEVSGDVTSLWYDDLNLQWKAHTMTLAGLTGEDVLFVLATLAPEYRMRVVSQEQQRATALTPDTSLALPKLYSWIIAPAGHP